MGFFVSTPRLVCRAPTPLKSPLVQGRTLPFTAVVPAKATLSQYASRVFRHAPRHNLTSDVSTCRQRR